MTTEQRQNAGHMGIGSTHSPPRLTNDVGEVAPARHRAAGGDGCQGDCSPRGRLSHSRKQVQGNRDNRMTTGVWKNVRDHA